MRLNILAGVLALMALTSAYRHRELTKENENISEGSKNIAILSENLNFDDDECQDAGTCSQLAQEENEKTELVTCPKDMTSVQCDFWKSFWHVSYSQCYSHLCAGSCSTTCSEKYTECMQDSIKSFILRVKNDCPHTLKPTVLSKCRSNHKDCRDKCDNSLKCTTTGCEWARLQCWNKCMFPAPK